jgi:hypothetical protein
MVCIRKKLVTLGELTKIWNSELGDLLKNSICLRTNLAFALLSTKNSVEYVGCYFNSFTYMYIKIKNKKFYVYFKSQAANTVEESNLYIIQRSHHTHKTRPDNRKIFWCWACAIHRKKRSLEENIKLLSSHC